MQAFDLLVNPSLTEGLPNVLLEAMALGIPVIATAVGGVPELLGDDRFGFVVPPGDSAALGRAVYRLASDPTGARQLVQNAYARLDDYSTEKHNQLLLDLYASVLNRSARASAEMASGPEPRASYSQFAMDALAHDGSSPDRRDSRDRAWHERSGDQ
jgi:glycogen synthase